MLDILKLFLPPLITVGVGGYFLNRFFVGRANLAALIERICDIIDQLRDDCAAYWSVGYASDAEEQAQQSVLETKIKAGVLQVRSLIELVRDNRPDLSEDVDVLTADLLDACTGGNFESQSRKAEKTRFMKIVTTTNRIAVELQRLKIWSPANFQEIDLALERQRMRQRSGPRERVI